MLGELILTVLAALGLAALAWLVFVWLLRGDEMPVTVYLAAGEAEALEQVVRRHRWLYRCGFVGKLFLAERALTEEAAERLDRLCEDGMIEHWEMDAFLAFLNGEDHG